MKSKSNQYARALWALLALFVLRVLGQAAVVFFEGSPPLPPMEKWQSGLLPYWMLLTSQILIIIVFSKIATDITRAEGFSSRKNIAVGLWLRNIGYVYFAGMILRFFIQGLSIPVIFHWILASFIIVLGFYHLSESRTPEPK